MPRNFHTDHWRQLALRAGALLALLALSACQTLPPAATTPWPERRADLQQVGQFTFRGQLAAASEREGVVATVGWQQNGMGSDVQLRWPLGLGGGAHVVFDGEALAITAGNGESVAGAAANEAMVRLVGFVPPLASLRYWLLGVPDPATPAEEKLDASQRLDRLRQGGWQVDYADYTAVGARWLPTRINARRELLQLKFHVVAWQLP